ncbi:MAG: ATP-binding protein [Planctomycetota bacterium]|nr:ATP-binding protein [Planctomycetota bacterium]
MSEIKRRDRPHELELDLPAAHSAGRMARQMAREFALAEGVPAKEVETLEFVAGELLDNAVDHGGGGGAREIADLPGDVRMQLGLAISGKEWTVTVGDQGGGDPTFLRDLIDPPDGFPDLEDERGRGFFLLAGMVDKLSVAPTPAGNGLALKATRRYGD